MVPFSPGCPLSVAIATPAELVDALFHGHDRSRAAAAWQRLLKAARRVCPEAPDDLAQDWARWLLEHPKPMASAQTLVDWSGLEQALRQHRERRRQQSPGIDSHPSPEREQLREGLRKVLASPRFSSTGRGRHRTYRLTRASVEPADPAHLRLTFDLSPSDSDERARTLVPRADLERFAVAWLSRPGTTGATLPELAEAAAQAGGHPFPKSRVEAREDHDAAGELHDPSLAADVERVTRDYLRTVPRRRLRVAALHYGAGLGLERVGPRLGTGKSTAGNEAKAFVEGLKAALAPLGAGLEAHRAAATLIEERLGGRAFDLLEACQGDGLSDEVWNALASGRFPSEER